MADDYIKRCRLCGEPVKGDAVGANYKFSMARDKEFLCLDCLAFDLGVSTEKLLQKIEEQKRLGCIYFASGS